MVKRGASPEPLKRFGAENITTLAVLSQRWDLAMGRVNQGAREPMASSDLGP